MLAAVQNLFSPSLPEISVLDASITIIAAGMSFVSNSRTSGILLGLSSLLPSVRAFDVSLVPVVVNNSLTISKGEAVILSSSDLAAINQDNNSTNMIFFAIDVQSGVFLLKATNRIYSVTSFSQDEIMNRQVHFQQDGTYIAPSYSIITQNDRLLNSTLNQALIIFSAPVPPPEVITHKVSASKKNIIRRTIIISCVTGTLGLSFFIFRLFLNKRMARSLKEQMVAHAGEDDRKTILAKEMFYYLKVGGFLGYVREADLVDYFRVFGLLLSELEKVGVTLDLKKLSAAEQYENFEAVVRETRAVSGLKKTCFGLSHFFKPEITPKNLEKDIETIAKNVFDALNSSSDVYESVHELPENVELGAMKPLLGCTK